MKHHLIILTVCFVQCIDLKRSNFRELLLKGRGGSKPSSSSGGSNTVNSGSRMPVTQAPDPAPQESANKKAPASTASNNTEPSQKPADSPKDSKKEGPSTPSSSGGNAPTFDQFKAAVAAYSKTSAGGTPPAPSQDVYNAYLKDVSSKLPFKEQAAFLAHCIWESGGLQFVEEIACKDGSCEYGKYYGRGYKQLTWDYNYKEASQDLTGDQTLLNNPDLVSKPEWAWKTAVWFWTKRVQPKIKANNAIDTFKLGYSTKVINGGIECPAGQQANNRIAIYNEILKAWGINSSNPGSNEGC